MGEINYSDGHKPSKNFKLDKRGTLAHTGPFVAEVMSTVDPTRNGRIRVWIKSFGDENNKYEESSWFTAKYLSPFYGVTQHKKIKAPNPDFEENGHAYGMWMNTPDVGVEVLVIFAESDPNQCYYIGFIPEPQMNHMIPAIAGQSNPHYNNSAQEEKCIDTPLVPVAEIDKRKESMEDAAYTEISKPIHSVVAGQMWKQGVLRDTVRGPITSSAQRESPSYVFGLSTPGRPIYASGLFDHEVRQQVESGEETNTSIKGRKGGHSFVLDDGDIDGNNSLIRIRTANGHQITLSDDGDSLFIMHANGKSWWELGAEGTIDAYAVNSINFRTTGDLNLHADKNINLNAGSKINLYSSTSMTLESESLALIGKQNLTAYGNTIGIKSDGSLSLDSGSSASWKAGGTIDLKGATIGLNNGSASSVSKPKSLIQNNHADTVMDNTLGWVSEDGQLKSVVSRLPTHEPFTGHGTGISDIEGFK